MYYTCFKPQEIHNFTFHKHELVWILLGVVRNQQEMWILAYILCTSHAKNDQEILPKIEYILK